MKTKQEQVCRFIVRSEEGKRSGLWLIWTSTGGKKSDIYVTVRPLAGRLKVSIHESGQCQASFNREFISEIEDLGTWTRNSRHLLKWSMRELAPGVALATRIIVPTSELTEIPISPKKLVVSVPAAPFGKAVEFALLLTEPRAKVTGWPGKRSMATQLVTKMLLANGNILWVVNRTVDPPQGDLDKVSDIEAARRGIVRLDSHDRISLLDRQLRIVLIGYDSNGVGYLADAMSPWKKSSVP
ncbi:MAG TPA: hypothetical protein VMW64_06970 [Dehalococcoidia bacterium]|nr:hypothetical protein [Dehalococcoidia bacterium]